MRLSGSTGTNVHPTFILELEQQVLNFPSNLASAAVSKYEDLDSNGTELWNACTRFRRSNGSADSEAAQNMVLLARVFAFLLIDCAGNNDNGRNINVVRLMKVALKAAKNCIG